LGTPANFNGFRVLAALLHGTPAVGVSQTYGVEQRAPTIFGSLAILEGYRIINPFIAPLDKPVIMMMVYTIQ